MNEEGIFYLSIVPPWSIRATIGSNFCHSLSPHWRGSCIINPRLSKTETSKRLYLANAQVVRVSINWEREADKS